MPNDLKIIKKYYGEEMMHFCREMFPTILEQAGSLSNILLNHFEPSKFLYQDIVKQNKEDNFKSFIYDIFDSGIREVEKTNKTPEELLSEAGYRLYECKTEENIQKFKKYYAKGEELCTFKTHRLNNCYVFFAVKKDVAKIKRENFLKPERQDEYGTSVISIQFARDESHLLSIKNRYNHTVPNPDATFSNNLDNIIEGLTDSFATHYGLQQRYINLLELKGYFLANDGKYYKYNYEINNIYYCPNNIIIDNGLPIHYEKEKYIIMDYFILDLENKKIYLYENDKGANDSKCIDTEILSDILPSVIGDIKKINIIKDNKNKIIVITPLKGENIKIILDSENRIIAYIDNNVKIIADDFLKYCLYIKKVMIPSAIKIGSNFCFFSAIEDLELPEVLEVENNFLYCNRTLRRLYAPKLKVIGNCFCNDSKKIEEVVLPALEICGYHFFMNSMDIRRLCIPNLQKIVGNYCFSKPKKIEEIDISNVSAEVSVCIEYNFVIKKHFSRKREK